MVDIQMLLIRANRRRGAACVNTRRPEGGKLNDVAYEVAFCAAPYGTSNANVVLEECFAKVEGEAIGMQQVRYSKKVVC